MAKNILNKIKLFFNKDMLGLLMNKSTRKLMKNMMKGNIFLSDLKKYPNKEAIIYGDKRFTYTDLNKRINRLNNGLISLGLKPGDHIAALVGNSNALLEIMFGPTLAGFFSTPINWHLKGDEIEYVVNNSDSKILFIEEHFLDKIIPIQSKLKSVKAIILVSDTNIKHDGMISYEKFLQDSSDADLKAVEKGGGFMLYTSGTTGKPKGTHSRALDDPSILKSKDIVAFVQMLHNMQDGFDFNKTTNRYLAAGPLYHAAPLAFSGITFANGGTIFIMKKFDAEEALKIIEKEAISTTFVAPILLKRLLNVKNKEQYNISSMKSIVCAAAPCPAELKESVVDFFGHVYYEFYGSTDGGVNTILKPKDYMNDPAKYASVGRVAPGNKIKIIGENGEILPIGTAGDLYLSNPMVKYLEYYKDAEKTKNSFSDINGEKYFIEGEVAYIDEDEFCYVVDRKKDMIISGGVNIYPVEIEEILHMHDSVMDVAIIGIPDEEWGESVKAFIVLKDNMEITEEEIISYCDQKLASYKKPRYVAFVNDIPRHPDGKLIKRILKENYRILESNF